MKVQHYCHVLACGLGRCWWLAARLGVIAFLFVSVNVCFADGLRRFSGLKTDIPIGSVDGVAMTINVAVPKGESQRLRSAIVVIHGGGLIKGNKDLLNKRLLSFAKRGYVTASVMYRLAPDNRFPKAIEDVHLAVRFLKAHAQVLNIDPEKIVLSGASAGGYLAVMAAVTANEEGFSQYGLYTNVNAQVSAVISHAAPIADYTLPEYHTYPIVTRFSASKTTVSTADLKSLSAITYLDENDPPFFLSHGSADELVPVEISRGFSQALKKLNHPHEYIEVQGGRHSLNRSTPAKAKDVFYASFEFIDKNR